MHSIDSILKGCLKNKRKDQKLLYDLYSPVLYGICIRYAKNHQDAQDILQEGFIKIFENLHTYKRKGSFEGWMKRIIINTALKKYKENISHLSVELNENESEYLEQTIYNDNIEIHDLINKVQNLPTQYRIVFNMYAIEGYSHKEIGENLGISETTSRTNYLRARNILREKLEQQEKVFAEYMMIR